MLRADTTNPPGSELRAAQILARKLGADNIGVEVVESAPERASLVARLSGTGTARPIILLSHLDVVPADARTWRVAPFAGVREEGMIYGRGALDCKGVGAIQTVALLAIERAGVRLSRDLILLATADEETGGRAGAGWLVEHRADMLGNAEFLLTEGGGIRRHPSGRYIAKVGVAEKTPCWLRLTAHGDAGHGSAPPPETAVTRLVRALDRVRTHVTPVRLVPAVEAYFSVLAELEVEPLRHALTHLRTALEDPAFLADFTRNPLQNALLRNTITPTVLAASQKTNVIPAEASAELDCRLLPGEKPDDFIAGLRRVIADDAIAIEPLLSFPASASPSSSPMVDAIGHVLEGDFPGSLVAPAVIAGFTDSHYFRDRGIASYGFVPFVLDDDDAKTVHGTNERVSVDNLRDGVRRLVAIVQALERAN